MGKFWFVYRTLRYIIYIIYVLISVMLHSKSFSGKILSPNI